MFNLIVSNILQYLKQFNFVDLCWQIIYVIYRNKPDLALNNQQCLICRKIKSNQPKIISKQNIFDHGLTKEPLFGNKRVKEFWIKNNIPGLKCTVIPCDLIPCKDFLIQKIKTQLRGHHLRTIDSRSWKTKCRECLLKICRIVLKSGNNVFVCESLPNRTNLEGVKIVKLLNFFYTFCFRDRSCKLQRNVCMISFPSKEREWVKGVILKFWIQITCAERIGFH